MAQVSRIYLAYYDIYIFQLQVENGGFAAAREAAGDFLPPVELGRNLNGVSGIGHRREGDLQQLLAVAEMRLTLVIWNGPTLPGSL